MNYLRTSLHSIRLSRKKKLSIAEKLTRKESLEVGLEEERLQKTELIDHIDGLRQKIGKQSAQLAGDEERLNYMRRTQTEKFSFIEMKIKENTTLLDETNERKVKLQDFNEQLELLKEEGSERGQDINARRRLGEVEERLNLKEDTLSALRRELDSDRNMYFEAERELFKETSNNNELTKNLHDISLEIESLEQQSSGISGEISEERETVNSAKQQVRELEQTQKEFEARALILQEQREQREKQIHILTKELVEKESRLKSLESLNTNYEDQESGTQKYLQNFQGDSTLLAALIQCEERYTAPVQAALKTRLNAIILAAEKKELSPSSG